MSAPASRSAAVMASYRSSESGRANATLSLRNGWSSVADRRIRGPEHVQGVAPLDMALGRDEKEHAGQRLAVAQYQNQAEHAAEGNSGDASSPAPRASWAGDGAKCAGNFTAISRFYRRLWRRRRDSNP